RSQCKWSAGGCGNAAYDFYDSSNKWDYSNTLSRTSCWQKHPASNCNNPSEALYSRDRWNKLVFTSALLAPTRLSAICINETTHPLSTQPFRRLWWFQRFA